MIVQILPGTLLPPSSLKLQNIEVWLEQQIWGHTFHSDQTPWLILLEALGIMASRAQNSQDVVCGVGRSSSHEDFLYSLNSRRILRYLLFKDRDLAEIGSRPTVFDPS